MKLALTLLAVIGMAAHLLLSAPLQLTNPLVLLAVLLELSGCPLPHFGFISLSFAAVGALAPAPDAALACLLALGLRTLSTRQPRAVLPDLLAQLAALEAWKAAGPLAALPVFVAVSWLAPLEFLPALTRPELAAWSRARGRAFPLFVLSAAGAPVLGLQPFAGVCMLLAGGKMAAELTRPEPDLTAREVAEEQGALQRDQLNRELTAFDVLLKRLAGRIHLPQIVDAVLDAVEQTLKADSYAVFLPLPGGLQLAGRRGGGEPPTASARQAWQTGRTVDGAVPLEAGVLAVAREVPWRAEEIQLLERLAALASIGLRSGLRQAGLEAWVERLVVLLQSARALAATREPEEVSERLEEVLRHALPHDIGMLCGAPADGELVTVSRLWPAAVEVDRLALTHITANAPSLATDGSAPAPEVRSVLACPIAFEYGPPGVIVLCSRQPEAFLPEHGDVLAMLATLGAIAFTNAHLYADLRESQAQVAQASKLAAVGQLAAGVAHELTTPRGAIALSVESALRRPEGAGKRLEPALRGVEQCRSIISKLLVFCREDRSQRRKVELHEVVAEALLLVGAQLRQDGVELKLELGPPAQVLVNPNEVQQILTNLLVNARDAGRRVELHSRVEGRRVLVTVTDDGPGMAPEVLERAFEPFFTTKEVGRGTGLGLSVSRELAHKNGGELRLTSSPGQGTRAELELSLA